MMTEGEMQEVEAASELSCGLIAQEERLKEENHRLLMANRDCIAWCEDARSHMDRYRKALEELDDYLDNAPTLRVIVRRALDVDA